MTLGERLAMLRKNAGMTQQQLGKALSISPQAVSKWEHDLAEPDLRTLKELSALYGIGIGELLGDECAAADAAPAKEEDEPQEEKKLIGYCVRCHRAVYGGNEMRTSLGLMCRSCAAEHSAPRPRTRRTVVVRRYTAAERSARREPMSYEENDRASFGWAFLSFLLSIFGFILFLCCLLAGYPNRAFSCLKGALAGVVIEIVAAVSLGACFL